MRLVSNVSENFSTVFTIIKDLVCIGTLICKEPLFSEVFEVDFLTYSTQVSDGHVKETFKEVSFVADSPISHLILISETKIRTKKESFLDVVKPLVEEVSNHFSGLAVDDFPEPEIFLSLFQVLISEVEVLNLSEHSVPCRAHLAVDTGPELSQLFY